SPAPAPAATWSKRSSCRTTRGSSRCRRTRSSCRSRPRRTRYSATSSAPASTAGGRARASASASLRRQEAEERVRTTKPRDCSRGACFLLTLALTRSLIPRADVEVGGLHLHRRAGDLDRFAEAALGAA